MVRPTQMQAPYCSACFPLGQFKKKNIFLMSTDYEKLRYDPLSIFAKWIDDDNLLIAAPEGSQLRAARRELKGINIQYVVYPLASENTKNEPYTAYDFQIRGVDEIERPDIHASTNDYIQQITDAACQPVESSYG